MTVTAEQQEVPRSDAYREAETLFQRTLNRINNLEAAREIWHRHLRRGEREALGGSLEEAIRQHRNPIRMWALARRVTGPHAVLQIGEALGSLKASDVNFILRETGELPRDPAKAREAAIDRGDLVLTRHPREAYWEGALIEVDWNQHKASWDFLMVAAESAKNGEMIDRLTFGESAADAVVAKKKSRLKSMQGFPASLIDKFRVEGRGTQRLDIPRKQIHIFDRGDE